MDYFVVFVVLSYYSKNICGHMYIALPHKLNR